MSKLPSIDGFLRLVTDPFSALKAPDDAPVSMATSGAQPESTSAQIAAVLQALIDGTPERVKPWLADLDVRGYISNPDADQLGALKPKTTVQARVLQLMALFAAGVKRFEIIDQFGLQFLASDSSFADFSDQFNHFWSLVFDNTEELNRPGNSVTSPARLSRHTERFASFFDLALADAAGARIEIVEGVKDDFKHVTYYDNRSLLEAAIRLTSDVPESDKAGFLERLKAGVKTIDIRFQFTKDDGQTVDVAFIRVQNNISRGPAKGGIRAINYDPKETIFDKEVKKHFGDAHFLSLGMSRKNAVADVPYGGGKGEIIFPEGLSIAERKRLFFTVGLLMAPYVGETQDVPAPDVRTGAPDMAAFRAGVEFLKIKPEPGVITGKPLEAGGVAGRPEATGAGGEKAIDLALRQANRMWNSVVAVVQGFGNVGNEAALRITRNNGKVVAISDHSATVKKAGGFTEAEILEYRKQASEAGKRNEPFEFVSANHAQGVEIFLQPDYKHKDRYPDIEQNGNALFEGAYNLVVPAARENAINEAQANLIGSNNDVIVASLANAPMHQNVVKILEDQEVTILPDIFANIGGVVVSFIEWLQNIHPRWDNVVAQMPNSKQGEMKRVWKPVADRLAVSGWQAEPVLAVMKKIMDFSYEDMKKIGETYNVNATMAAEVLAVNRLYAADVNRPKISGTDAELELDIGSQSYGAERMDQLLSAATLTISLGVPSLAVVR